MEIVVEGEFSLGEFSPNTLEFVPELNCVLASNGCGEVAIVDVVTGHIQKYKGKVKCLYTDSWKNYVCIIVTQVVYSVVRRGVC